jgi:hypothetical protein
MRHTMKRTTIAPRTQSGTSAGDVGLDNRAAPRCCHHHGWPPAAAYHDAALAAGAQAFLQKDMLDSSVAATIKDAAGAATRHEL